MAEGGPGSAGLAAGDPGSAAPAAGGPGGGGAPPGGGGDGCWPQLAVLRLKGGRRLIEDDLSYVWRNGCRCALYKISTSYSRGKKLKTARPILSFQRLPGILLRPTHLRERTFTKTRLQCDGFIACKNSRSPARRPVPFSLRSFVSAKMHIGKQGVGTQLCLSFPSTR